jgi:hypothetical protein
MDNGMVSGANHQQHAHGYASFITWSGAEGTHKHNDCRDACAEIEYSDWLWLFSGRT